jgi:hypothetical protein
MPKVQHVVQMDYSISQKDLAWGMAFEGYSLRSIYTDKRNRIVKILSTKITIIQMSKHMNGYASQKHEDQTWIICYSNQISVNHNGTWQITDQ